MSRPSCDCRATDRELSQRDTSRDRTAVALWTRAQAVSVLLPKRPQTQSRYIEINRLDLRHSGKQSDKSRQEEHFLFVALVWACPAITGFVAVPTVSGLLASYLSRSRDPKCILAHAQPIRS